MLSNGGAQAAGAFHVALRRFPRVANAWSNLNAGTLNSALPEICCGLATCRENAVGEALISNHFKPIVIPTPSINIFNSQLPPATFHLCLIETLVLKK